MTDELESFFDAERGHEEAPPPEARDRIRAAVSAAVANGGGGGGGGGGTGPEIPRGRALLGMLTTFVAGGVVGALAMRAAVPEREAPAPQVSSVAVAPAPSPPPPLPRAGDVVMELPDTRPPASASASGARPRPTSETKDASQERTLLDAARVALAEGRPAETLALTDRHAKDFADGRLAEEREALAVRALVKVGRHDEARTRGAAFRAKWPNSLAGAAVDAALGSIP